MLARTGLATLLCLVLFGQAEAKKSRKRKISRDRIREESIALWPSAPQYDRRIGKVGVPELDRLLVEHPPLGEPVSDKLDGLDDTQVRRFSADSRDRGLSAVAVPGGDLDPLERLKRVAEPLLGSPYRTGGENPKGFDCSGFVRTVLRAFGQDLEGRSSISYSTQGVPVDKEHLQTGDLLFFADHHRSIGHVGIYLADGKFVHASVQRGVIVSDLDEKYYRAKYKGARRQEDFTAALTSAAEDPNRVP